MKNRLLNNFKSFFIKKNFKNKEEKVKKTIEEAEKPTMAARGATPHRVSGAYVDKRIGGLGSAHEVVHGKSGGGKGKWIAALIAVFILGLLLGYGAGYTPKATQIVTQAVTTTITTDRIVTVTTKVGPTSPTPIEEGLLIRIGEPTKVMDWEIPVSSVKEASYIKSDDSYYKPKEGMKAIIIDLRIKNLGIEIEYTSDIWSFVLVTDKARSCEKAYLMDLEYILSRDVTTEIREQAVEYKELPWHQAVAPNTYSEGQIIFQFSVDEKPVKMYFKVGIFSPKQVVVPLT